MKIKSILPIVLAFCLIFALCACNNDTSGDGTTAPITTEDILDGNETTAPAGTDTETAEFTAEDAIEKVKSTYTLEENCYLLARSTEEIDGVTYYAVDLMKSMETNSTYLSTYFVKADGSEIVLGYYYNGEPVLDERGTVEFTEEDAVKMVEEKYTIDANCYLHVRGIAEVDGAEYYGVDLMKYIDSNTTYLSTYFVKTDGSEIKEGYYQNNTPVFAEKTALEITEENAVKAVEAAYDFEDGCYLMLRGTEEIDGVTYYAVDLMKSLEYNSTYLSTFFVKSDGTQIVKGYYQNNTPVLAE